MYHGTSKTSPLPLNANCLVATRLLCVLTEGDGGGGGGGGLHVCSVCVHISYMCMCNFMCVYACVRCARVYV